MNTGMTVGGGWTSRDDRVRRTSPAEVLALLYAGSLPFNGLSIGGRSLPFLVGLVYLPVAVISSLDVRSARRGERTSTRSVVIAALFVLYCGLGYYWSLAPDLTLTQTTTLLVMLGTSWFLAKDVPRLVRSLPVAYVVGSIPVALLVLAAPASTMGRKTAYGNANYVALGLVLGVVCAFWIVLRMRGLVRLLAVASAPLLVAGTIATGSRTSAIAGAAAVVAAVFWLAWRREWRPLAMTLALSAIVGAVLSAAPGLVIPDRLVDMQYLVAGDSLSNRTYIWQAILERGFDLIGIGAGATPAYLQASIGGAYVAHNVLLGVLLEGGILGAVLFLSTIVSAVICGRRSPFSGLLFLVLPVMVAASMTLSVEAIRPLWFMIALAWAVPAPEADAEAERVRAFHAHAPGGVAVSWEG